MGKDNANLLFFEDKVIVKLSRLRLRYSRLYLDWRYRVGNSFAFHLPDIPFGNQTRLGDSFRKGSFSFDLGLVI